MFIRNLITTDWTQTAPFVLGLLTAVNPCPLATQAAALLAICGWGGSPGRNLLRGTVLAAGMGCTYMLLAGSLSVTLECLPLPWLPDVCGFFLAPALVITGICMTGAFPLLRNRRTSLWFPAGFATGRAGLAGQFLLGAILALAFCPASAGLFFGVLIPAAIQRGTPVTDAAWFGLGVTLPMLTLTVAIACGLRSAPLRPFAERVTAAAGWLLIALGTVLTLRLV